MLKRLEEVVTYLPWVDLNDYDENDEVYEDSYTQKRESKNIIYFREKFLNKKIKFNKYKYVNKTNIQ